MGYEEQLPYFMETILFLIVVASIIFGSVCGTIAEKKAEIAVAGSLSGF